MKKKNGLLLYGLADAAIVLCACAIFGFWPWSGGIFARLAFWIFLIIGIICFVMKSNKTKAVSDDLTSPSPVPKTAREALDLLAHTRFKVFKKQERTLKSQLERMVKKDEQLDQSLKEYFGASKISYEKFASTITGVRNVFLDNTYRIIRRVDLFDEAGYEDLLKKHQEHTDAIKPYQESFDFIDDKLNENEKILNQMDRLLLEVNSLNENQVSVEDLPAMQEMKQLIEQTKLYQQK